MDRASDNERLYQCLTCKFTEICDLDEKAEDERGLCKEYQKSEQIIRLKAKEGDRGGQADIKRI